MSGKTIASKLSRLLSSAAKMSYPNASKVKVNHFLQSSGDPFEFYERAESEAPESELGPVLLCSKCSAPLSRSDLDISVETQHQPSYLESPAYKISFLPTYISKYAESKIFRPTQLHLNKYSTREISLCIN